MKTFHMNLFGLPDIVLFNSIENVTYVLKDNFESYGKGPVFKARFQGLLGDGIFNTDGTAWFQHRKTSAHLFNTNKFRTTVLDTFNHHCDALIDIINGKGKGTSFDIASLMFKYTLDSIGLIAFGADIGSLHQERVEFADCFDYCQEAINQSFFDPFWYFKRLFTPAGWWFFVSLSKVNKYALGVVKAKRAKVAAEKEEGKVGGGDLLSLYLDRSEDGTITSELTDSYLRDVVLNFVIAGRDTTAQALSWSFYRLCIHPEVQSSLRRDILNVLAQQQCTDPSKISYECLQNMKYLEAFCMEVLRYSTISIFKYISFTLNFLAVDFTLQCRRN